MRPRNLNCGSRPGSISSVVLLAVLTLVGGHSDTVKYPHDYAYLISHPELCGTDERVSLLIMVHSAFHHFQARLTVRQTWGSVAKRKDVRLLFLLGYPTRASMQPDILEEDRIYGDLLQEDFLDTYHNLTLKTVMMVKWATAHCPHARHLLKIDDDCFLNPHALLEFLRDRPAEATAIFGQVWTLRQPFREKTSKWYVPVHMYPKPVYPDFAAGPSYVLSRKAVPLLYATTLTTKPIHLEDVYLNGICAEKARIPRINASGFYVPLEQVVQVGAFRKAVLTIHDLPRARILLLWWLLMDTRGQELDAVLTSLGETAVDGLPPS